jgi:hypothetical protein
MFKVFEKSEEEFLAENRVIQQDMNNEEPRANEICLYYVVDNLNNKVDVDALSEEQLIAIYKRIFKEFVVARANKNCDKKGFIESIYEAEKLTSILKNHHSFSLVGVKKILEMCSPYSFKFFDNQKLKIGLNNADLECYRIATEEVLMPLIQSKVDIIDMYVKDIKEISGTSGVVSNEERIRIIENFLEEKERRKVHQKDNLEFSSQNETSSPFI